MKLRCFRAWRMGACQRPQNRSGRNTSGFALIVTVSMMVLLALLAVGLLSLSTIAVRSSSAGRDMEIARANARLGMQIAIGQLQTALGADQRATALAELQNPEASNPKWLGVYGNEAPASYSLKPSQIPEEPYKPVLLNWLISGNEEVSFAAATSGTNYGQITDPPESIPFSPSDIVNLEGAPTIKSEKAALLVSNGSAIEEEDFVAAPIVPVTDTDGETNGGYAYWTADEGMKARINLRENHRQQTSASKAEEGKRFSFMTAQRSGIEVMSRDVAQRSQIGADWDPANEDIENLVTTGLFPLVSSGLRNSDILQYRYHDITAYSKSVIADSYAGGLKQDMGAVIYGRTGPQDTDPLFTPESTSEFGLPTYGHLRSWANFTAPFGTPPPNASEVRPYTSTQTRFGPVISMAAFGIGVQRVPRSTNELRVQLYPALILWNPYTVGIPEANYEVGFRFRPASPGGDAMNIQTAENSNGPWKSLGSFNLSGGNSDMTEGEGFFRFAIQGSEIPAGESHVYLVQNYGSEYETGSSVLVRAPNTSPIGYNTRYLATTQRFAFTGSNPYIRFQSNYATNHTMSNGDLREVILTEPGGLSNGYTSSTPVYQALTDMNLYNRHFPATNGTPLQLTTIGLQPPLVFRSQIMMESRGGFSADWRKTGAMRDVSGKRGQERNRWIASQNPIAPYIKRTRLEANLQHGAFSHGSIATGDLTDKNNMMMGIGRITNYLAGVGGDQSPGADAPLIDVLPDSSMLLSLGQFQHAMLNPYVFGTTYAFGNSGANVGLPRNRHYQRAYVARPGDRPDNYQDPLYDIPWHVNRALWDRYFISTASQSLSQNDLEDGLPLPNARMDYRRLDGSLPDVSKLRPSGGSALEEAAANLMVAGGFNVNSTSVNAWRAVLTGTNKLTAPSDVANPTYSNTPLSAMIPRFSRDTRKSNGTNGDGLLNMWDSSGRQRYNIYRGNRELLMYRQEGKTSESPEEAQERLYIVAGELAQKIVDEVRLRGPFLSLADFVNRDLTTGDEGIRGALQAAIDKMRRNEVNPRACFNRIGAFVNDDPINKTVPGWDAEHYMGTPLSERGGSSNCRTAMAPKHLTQADLLSTIGPSLSARSDTFVIRSYGESVNPGTDTVAARAWCEAVVQRTPDYMDPADEASVSPQDLTSKANKTFGRKFEIVTFRWLSPDEI